LADSLEGFALVPKTFFKVNHGWGRIT
jgi:hypothetical protein